MRQMSSDDWTTLLRDLNEVVFRSELRLSLPESARMSGWCGNPPATNEEILDAEKRLGVVLPPSYRLFLRHSNGWAVFSSFIDRLWPVQQIARFKDFDPQRSL